MYQLFLSNFFPILGINSAVKKSCSGIFLITIIINALLALSCDQRTFTRTQMPRLAQYEPSAHSDDKNLPVLLHSWDKFRDLFSGLKICPPVVPTLIFWCYQARGLCYNPCQEVWNSYEKSRFTDCYAFSGYIKLESSRLPQ